MRTATLTGALTLLALSASASACDSGDSSIVPVQGIRVTPQSLVLPAIGATSQLLATIQPANATDQAITWESTDASVVSVDAAGVVTAVTAGSGVFVTAITHDGQFQSSANVSVVPPAVPVEGIRVTPQSLVLPAIGATSQLLATIQPANATDQAVTWESTDASVVSVNADGLVTARAVGSGVFVTAITHDGHFQSSANVSVNP